MPANPLELLAPHLRYLLGAAHEAAGAPISTIGHTLTQAAPAETFAGLGHAPIHLATGTPHATPDLLQQLQPVVRPPATPTIPPVSPDQLPRDLSEAGLRLSARRGSQLDALDLYERMQAAHAGAHAQLQAGTIHPDVAFSQQIRPRSTPTVFLPGGEGLPTREVPNPFLRDPASATPLEPQLRSMVDEALLRGDKAAASDAARTYLSLYTSGRLEELSRASAIADAPDFAVGGFRDLGRYDEAKLGAGLLKDHPYQEFGDQSTAPGSLGELSPFQIVNRTALNHYLAEGGPKTSSLDEFHPGRGTRHGLLPTDSGDHAATLARFQSVVDLGGPAGDRAKAALEKYTFMQEARRAGAQGDAIQARAGRPPLLAPPKSTGGPRQAAFNAADLAVSHPIDGAGRARPAGTNQPKPDMQYLTKKQTQHWTHVPELGTYLMPFDESLSSRYRVTPQVSRTFDTTTGHLIPTSVANDIVRRLGERRSVAPGLGRLESVEGKVDSVALYRDLRRSGVSEAGFRRAVVATGKFDSIRMRGIGHGPKGSTTEKLVLWADRKHYTLANTRWAPQ